MSALRQFFSRMVRKEHWFAEFWSAITLTLWGILNYCYSDELSQYQAFGAILRLRPEEFWEGAAVLVGGFQLYSLGVDRRWLRFGAAVACCYIYAVMTAGMVIAAPSTPNLIFIAGYVGINVFAGIRLSAANLR